MKAITYPAWFSSPDGKTAVFEAAEDVPKDWTSGAEGQSVTGEAKPPAAKPRARGAAKPAPAKPRARGKNKPKAPPLDL